MMFNDPAEIAGRAVLTVDGDKIGKVDTVFLDVETNRPEWAAVKTGMFGSKVSLIPLAAATQNADGDLTVPFDKDMVKNAPHHDADQDLSPQDEDELFQYYAVPAGGTQTQAYETSTTAAQTVDPSGHDTSGPNTDRAMTRSEERLHVGTERVETGRARLRKYVVTEQVTQSVPVSHEELRIEREPITEANVGDATDGPAISEEEHEVVLHAERPVVATETVPVERVRLETETVADTETVTGEVRKEQIDLNAVDDDRSARR